VDDENLACQVWFVYGTSSSALNMSTPVQDCSASTKWQQFTAAITGRAADTTYYFQAIATNLGGTSSGAILSFKTPSQSGTSSRAQLQ
jgi:TctA family transporter